MLARSQRYNFRSLFSPLSSLPRISSHLSFAASTCTQPKLSQWEQTSTFPFFENATHGAPPLARPGHSFGSIALGNDPVPVPGINKAVFLVLVKFLYYGEIYAEGVDKKEIFKVADRFDCQALKDKMERDLCDQIRMSNCLEFMILAEAHSCPLRLQQSVRVVAKHIRLNISSLNTSF